MPLGDMPSVVTLAGQTVLAGFRRAARSLLVAGIRPEDVTWRIADADMGDLFADAAGPSAEQSAVPPANAPRVPPAFLELCANVVLHSAPQRHALLYRMLWRLVHEPGLRHDTLDPDRVYLDNLVRAVRRDMHKMKAFVRFRPLENAPPGESGPGPLHVAWFEPEHYIAEAVAPFFQRRYTQMRWAILTPRRSVQWDGTQISLGPGGNRDQAPPADAGEQLWLTYYEHIFNPARLKVQAMTNEMPRRYWPNLPEAALIAPLVAGANQRSADMIAQEPTVPLKPRPVVVETHPRRGIGITVPRPGMSLIELKAGAERCRACPIGEHATQVVFGEGPQQARLMVVGEQPGDQEDLQGRPFTGPAGQLFERALAQLGWSRDALYVTNAVKHFKFEMRGKRRLHKTPAQSEADACLQWLESEIALVRPQAIIALGATAARSLLKYDVAVTKERGQWLQRPDARPVLVTLHPSALLRMDANGEEAFRQWLQDLDAATVYAQAQPVLDGAVEG